MRYGTCPFLNLNIHIATIIKNAACGSENQPSAQRVNNREHMDEITQLMSSSITDVDDIGCYTSS